MTNSFEFDVFLSHSSRDKTAVRELAERLKRDGLRVWLDEWVIQPGDSISQAVENGLECSRTLVLIMSEHSVGKTGTSDWVTLEHHTAMFRDPTNKERRFIPLRLDECDVKDSLKQFAYVDWRVKNEAEYAKLLDACRPPTARIPHLPRPHTGPFWAGSGPGGGSLFEKDWQAAPDNIRVLNDPFMPVASGKIRIDQAALLFPFAEDIACEVGNTHPDVQGYHADNVETGAEIYRALGLPAPTATDETLFTKGDLVVCGSPTSSQIAAKVFGHAAVSINPPPNPLGLPFTYSHEPCIDKRSGSVIQLVRFLKSKEHRTGIRGVFRKDDPIPTYVRVNRDNGEQLTDYLLLTVLPNFLNDYAFRSGGRLIIVGGVHGIGTRAFPLVFANSDVWQAFEPKLKDKRNLFFQAIFEVSRIRHDSQARISYPLSIEYREDRDFCSLPKKEIEERVRATFL